MSRPKQIIELYKAVQPSGKLFPVATGLDFWDNIYYKEASGDFPGVDNHEIIDREFARRFTHFHYIDFLEADQIAETLEDFKKDILSILTCNQKRYAEMYRVFLVTDEEDPITYNYDMTETTGAQHTATQYGAISKTKGQETFTKGAQTNTEGTVTNTHAVAPFNSDTAVTDATDSKTAQDFTDGQRMDTYGTRNDTEEAHTDTVDSNAWTLTRKGNIGVQTAGDILRIHSAYWTETYKFLRMIFDDICKELLLIGE